MVQKMGKTAMVMTLAVLALVLIPGPAFGADTSLCPEKTISVSGSGEIMATPDISTVIFGVQTENQDVKIAQQENAQITDGMISALTAAGIPREDIKTVGYTISPVYEDTNLPFGQKVKYYQVTSSVQVTIRDVNRTGEIIDIAVANGANQVNSIAFSLSEERESLLRSEALTLAVTNARHDADTVARATGVIITGVQSVSVGSVYVPVYYDNRLAAGAESKAAPVPTPIEPGQLSVTAQVSISYLIQ
jgi:uncharacterized protein YggE